MAGFVFLFGELAGAQNSKFTADASGNLLSQTSDSIALPQILAQPRDQIIIPSYAASFSVLVADPGGISYQWEFNGSPISGATSDALLVTNVSTNNAGLYSVVVTNMSGSIASGSATLYIDSDGDGLPDSWEIAHFGNLNQTASGDPDGDGVSNLQEFLDGTDPTNAASVLYRISLENDGGDVIVSPNQTAYTSGQIVTLTATGSGAYPFHAWTGDIVTRSNSISIVMTTNRSLYAHFLPFAMTWTNTLPGDWNTASNWTPNLAPGSNENVVLSIPVQVTLNNDVALVNFTFGGGNTGPNLTGSGRMSISSLGTWYSGTMSGSGATVVNPGATFNIVNTSAIGLITRTFENAGTITWLNGGYINMLDGVITNDAGALFQLGSPAVFNYNGGSPRFDNAGIFQAPPGAAISFYSVPVNNYGTINLTNGNYLTLAGGGLNSGTIGVAAGATINFSGGTFTGSPGSSLAGAGTLVVTSGNINLAGTVNVSATNSFTGGVTELNGNYTCVSNTLLDISGAVYLDGTGTVAPNNLNLNGTLGGAQSLIIKSNMNWYGGSMVGSGTTLIPAGASLNVAAFTGYGGVGMNGRTLENAGSATFGGGNMGLLSATILNDVGALFQVNGPLAFNYQGGFSHFDNSGIFLPSPSGLTAFYGITFNNFSTVTLAGSGTLSLSSGTNSGTITVPAAATFNPAGGTFNATGSSSITGAGALLVSGGTANLAGTVNLTGTNSFISGTANLTGNYTCVGNTLLNISGGTVNFDGIGTTSPNNVILNGALGGANTVTVNSSMNWTGGSMSGSGQTIIRPGATLNIAAFTGNGGVYLTDRTLENSGTVVWGGGNFGCNSVITNDAGATFQIVGNAAFNFQGGAPHFDNAGIFLPSSTGTTVFNGISVSNYGIINLTGGSVLYLNGGGNNSGSITVPTGAALNLAGVGVNGSAGSLISGAGTLIVSGGNSTMAGTVNVTGTNSFSSGFVDFTGNYTCVGNTLLDISGGSVSFDGNSTVAPNNVNLSGTLGGANLVTVSNTMNWSGGTMNGSGKTIIGPHATLTIAAFTGYGGVYLTDRTLENSGTVVWGGGNFGCNSVITNDAGATFQILGNAAFNFQGGAPRFDNNGTLNSAVVSMTAFNGVTLNNYATIGIRQGILYANGGYVCSTNSTLNCALGGTVPGATFGQLQVSGTANIKGSLKVYLTNYYIPKSNDTFAVVSASAINGGFGSFTYPSNQISMSLSNAPASEIVRVTSVSLQQSNAFPVPGMISWYRAENNANDSVGTNNGTITNGVTYSTGEVGQSFLFDGSSGCVYVPDSASLHPASVTLEAWVKIYSTNGIQLVIAKPLGTNTLDSYGLAIQNGETLGAICDTNGFGVFLSDTNVLTLGQWHHLAFTFDANTGLQALYTDGALVTSGSAGKFMSYDNHPLLLGADIENNVPNYFINGQIDEASIYGRALTADEIGSIFNVGAVGKIAVSPIQQPVLHIETITPMTARIFWSTNSSAFNLQYNTHLGSTNWAASGLTPVINGTNFVVTNLLTDSQKYYRLSLQPAVYATPAPSLKIATSSVGMVQLTWSANDDRTFVIQYNTNLTGINWVTSSNAPSLVGFNYAVTIPTTGKQMYYRLLGH